MQSPLFTTFFFKILLEWQIRETISAITYVTLHFWFCEAYIQMLSLAEIVLTTHHLHSSSVRSFWMSIWRLIGLPRWVGVSFAFAVVLCICLLVFRLCRRWMALPLTRMASPFQLCWFYSYLCFVFDLLICVLITIVRFSTNIYTVSRSHHYHVVYMWVGIPFC